MNGPKLVLLFSAIAYFFFGIWGFFSPESLLAPVGLILNTAAGRTDIRAFYGAQEIAFGIFLLQAIRRDHLRSGATLGTAALMLGCAIGRLLSMGMEGFVNPLLLGIAAIEAVGGVANVWAYRRCRREGL